MNEKVFWIALAEKNLAAIAVAREIGVHHTTLSRWVRGWYSVPFHYRSKLAEILEVKLSELFPENDGDLEKNGN